MSQAAAVSQPAGLKIEGESKAIFGFWVYLMTDCVLFASLFAVYAVLRNNTFGGPSGSSLFSLPYVLVETLLLLTSSLSCGLSLLAAQAGQVKQVLAWLGTTFVLGGSFLAMELSEFHHLVSDGNSWRRSGFLSSYFTLVGTHGLHIAIGLLWLVLLVPRIARRGLSATTTRRLTMFSLFWHFLDVIWILIFTLVYLVGVIKI